MKIHVINDYDLVLLVDNNLSANKINFLRRKLENTLSIRQVDISTYTKNSSKLCVLYVLLMVEMYQRLFMEMSII